MNFIKTIVWIIAGAILLPALFMFALGLGSTIFAFLANPKVMAVILGILLIISIPGILLGMIIKR